MLTVTRKDKRTRVAAATFIIATVLLVAALLSGCAQDGTGSGEGTEAEVAQTSLVGHDASVVGSGLPALVDLGSDTCVPCKMMEPVLEELASELDGRLHVIFINTNEDRSAGGRYGIRVIPTQIFFAPDGSELFRHQGFLSLEDILAKWSELGYEFGNAGEDTTGDAAGEA